jgi:hypothetical protein
MLLALLPFAAGAQTPPTTPAPPTFKVRLETSTDSGVFTNIFAIHVLSDGSVLAVDAVRRRLLVFDSTLKNFKVTADTAGQAPTRYGNSQGGMISYPGDSAVFLEQESGALIHIDRNGKLGRISTLPRTADMRFLAGPLYGRAGFDVQGRLFYRTQMANPPMFREGMRDTSITMPDSAPVLRANLDARTIDTIARIKIASVRQNVSSRGSSFFINSVVNPIPTLDEWAYDRDGIVAIIRGHDYHIDWILPDGKTRSTPKMPMAWRRISDEERVRIVDSTKRQIDSTRQALMDRVLKAQTNPSGPRPEFGPVPEVVKPEELPEYYPAIKATSRPRFDLDGNLWVVPGMTATPTSDGGLLYDVIDRNGTIIKRVNLPAGRLLSAFGPNNVIYMVMPTTAGWTRIDRGVIVPAIAK